jgi:DNA polymerase-3 subunit epsilon
MIKTTAKKKILWIDTETTGTDPTLHSVIQIANIIDIDGKIEDKFVFNVQPHPDFEIAEGSIAVHGISTEQMQAFPEMKIVHSQMLQKWNKYIDKFNRNDKFIIAGQKINFDIDFLSHFFMRLNDNFLGSYLDFRSRIELLDLTKGLRMLDIIKSSDLKLETLCKEFGIKIQAHDALSDITATKELYYYFKNNLEWKTKQ